MHNAYAAHYLYFSPTDPSSLAITPVLLHFLISLFAFPPFIFHQTAFMSPFVKKEITYPPRMMEWRRSNTGKSILPAFPNKLIGHSSGGVGGAVWFKKKKKKKRYLTESPSLILMPFGKISLTKRVFLSYVGNIEILSFLFHFLCRILPSAAHRQSFRGPARLSDLHYALVPSVDFFYIPLPFFHHGFPLIQCLRGHRRYSLCFHVGSSSVRQKKGSQSHLLSQAFQDLSNVSRLFRPHQPYTLSCFSPGGNGQLPSHALGRRRWAQGIFNPTL